jgi:hypothetical protein
VCRCCNSEHMKLCEECQRLQQSMENGEIF